MYAPETDCHTATIVSPGRAKKYFDALWTSSSVKAIMMPPTRSASSTASTEMIALPCVIRRNVSCHFDGIGGGVCSTGPAPGAVMFVPPVSCSLTLRPPRPGPRRPS